MLSAIISQKTMWHISLKKITTVSQEEKYVKSYNTDYHQKVKNT